jgi:hypothetical protein
VVPVVPAPQPVVDDAEGHGLVVALAELVRLRRVQGGKLTDVVIRPGFREPLNPTPFYAMVRNIHLDVYCSIDSISVGLCISLCDTCNEIVVVNKMTRLRWNVRACLDALCLLAV